MRHDDVQRVGGAALKQHDQHLAARVAVQRRALEQILREDGLAQERRAQPHRRERHRARLHEHSAIHSDYPLMPIDDGCLSALKFRRTERQPHDLCQTLQIHRAAETGDLRRRDRAGIPCPAAAAPCCCLPAAAPPPIIGSPSSAGAMPFDVVRRAALHVRQHRDSRRSSAPRAFRATTCPPSIDFTTPSTCCASRQRAKRVELRPVVQPRTRQLTGGETQPKVDAVEDRAGVHPRVAAIRPAVRRLAAEDRLPEPRHELRRARRRVGLRIHRAQCRRHDLERRLHLRAVRRRG